jgi:hypothetical protein
MQAKRPGQVKVPLISKIFQFRRASASSSAFAKIFRATNAPPRRCMGVVNEGHAV